MRVLSGLMHGLARRRLASTTAYAEAPQPAAAVVVVGGKKIEPVTVDEFKGCMAKLLGTVPSLASSIERRKIAIAFSGGPDSLALCALARQAYPRSNLVAIFVDHGCQARGVSESATAVKAALERLDIEAVCLSVRWPADAMPEDFTKGSLQEHLREARYSLMMEACVAQNASILLTGHNLDDDVATMMYRMCHGSGVDGLAGMKAVSTFPLPAHVPARAPSGQPLQAKAAPVDGDKESQCLHLVASYFVGHPLLSIPKARLHATCEEMHLPWVRDASNDDLDYRRNAVTHSLKVLAEASVTSAEALQEALFFFKDVRRHMHQQLVKAFTASVALDPANGDATLILNNTQWLSQRPVAVRLLNILAQYAASSQYPTRTRRINDLYDQMAEAYAAHTEAQRKWLRRLPRTPWSPLARSPGSGREAGLASNEMQPIDLTKRVVCSQMTIGGAIFYPLARADALRRIDNIKEATGRLLEYGPSFLVQRQPPARVNTQLTSFGARQFTLRSGQTILWDGRIHLTFTDVRSSLRGNEDAPACPFYISFMTPADVHDFESILGKRTREYGRLRQRIFRHMATTPGTHLYQIPVIRQRPEQEGSEESFAERGGYIAFPTLGVDYPPQRYGWKTTCASNALFISRFHCLP